MFDEYTSLLEDGQEEQREGFHITDDDLADWAVRKIKAEEEENARLHEIAQKQLDAISERIAAADKRLENNTAFLKGKLSEYFGTVPHKQTKTTDSYQLLSGKLVYTFPKINMVPDKDKALEYFKANGLQEYVKVTEAPAWGEYKKRLAIAEEDNSVIDTETGDILDFVTLEEGPAKFEVK